LVTQEPVARVAMVAGLTVAVRGVVEVLEPFGAGECGVVDAAVAAAFVAVVARLVNPVWAVAEVR
jgi:CelD/BcsL family acetyltransferase involved in cellulose biosynthesis